MTGLPAPTGFDPAAPPRYFDVSTTATYTGPITVCLDVTPLTFTGSPRLFHLEDGVWADHTVSFDPVAHQVCAVVSSLSPFLVAYDSAPPSTTVATDPSPNGAGWYRGPVSLTFTAVDAPASGSGVKEIVVTTIGATTSDRTFAGGSASLVVSAEGITTVRYFARDNNGNQESAHDLVVRIDMTPPEAHIQFDPATHDLALFGSDDGSGTSAAAIAPTIAAGPGRERRIYRVLDHAGKALELVISIERDGNELRATIVTLRYEDGEKQTTLRNDLAFQWALGSDGTLRSLEQRVSTETGSERQEIDARFDARSDMTEIKVKRNAAERQILRPGLALIRLDTHHGSLIAQVPGLFASIGSPRLVE